jgi:hypothetical protein
VHGEQLAPVSGALPVSPFKIRRVGQACSLAPRHRSDSQSLTPTPAPGGDDPAPTDRAHALAKTVRLGPFPAVRLVSTLHETPLTGTLNSAEYIRSYTSHPAPGTAGYRSDERPADKLFERKVLQSTCEFWRANIGRALACPPSGGPRVLRVAVAACFSTSCPQPVDKTVDKHVNILQKQSILPNALAS